MPFAETQIRQLSGKLLERHVRTREQKGLVLSYVEGWHVIAEANRIFGFDGWDRETLSAECVWQDTRSAIKVCTYTARVRVRVRAGETVICRDGSGVGHGNGAIIGEAHESALKEAETDATKRALTTFGNLFGLALYDKERVGLRRTRKQAPGPIDWTFVNPKGGMLSSHKEPVAFCRAFKEAIYATNTEATLVELWERNRLTIDQLRIMRPDLRTGKGNHCADVLVKHYERQALRLKEIINPSPIVVEQNVSEVSIDKSELAIAAPKRIRDQDHLRFVASQPCLICGRSPTQAHHLRFAQLRSMGSKVSDEWTVPLCSLHHRALHDVGDEVAWWGEREIDPISEAEKLWKQNSDAELHRDKGGTHS